MTSNTDSKARNMVIIGVVKDMNFADVQYKIEPIMFLIMIGTGQEII